jgi:hypothetical protein
MHRKKSREDETLIPGGIFALLYLIMPVYGKWSTASRALLQTWVMSSLELPAFKKLCVYMTVMLQTYQETEGRHKYDVSNDPLTNSTRQGYMKLCN